VAFVVSAAVMGGPVAVAVLDPASDARRMLVVSAIVGAGLQAIVVLANAVRMGRSSQPEARASLTLMLHHRRVHFAGRVVTLAAVAVCGAADLVSPSLAVVTIMAGAAILGEVLGRYLFYVTVVPLAMPGRFNGAWR
jgi:DMSO reductase anchor subunit